MMKGPCFGLGGRYTMRRKTCCVIGGKNVPFERMDMLQRALEQELEKALKDGCSRMICGFSGPGDMLFARLVRKRKTQRPRLFLEAFLISDSEIIGTDGKLRTELTWCNGIRVFSHTMCADGSRLRDEEMVLNSDRIIAILNGPTQRETYLCSIAQSAGKDVGVIRMD